MTDEARSREQEVNRVLGEVFKEVADAIEGKSPAAKISIGLTITGSELGEGPLIEGARLAERKRPDLEVTLIGPRTDSALKQRTTNGGESDAQIVMEESLRAGDIAACVTMHYNFPIGTATVGRIVTPAYGNEMYIATTTGTSDTDRVRAMLKNTVYGIACAKAAGVAEPKVGVLNIEGARLVERRLRDLAEQGDPILFAESVRSDGGAILRGNDLLVGAADVVVTDSLTGNVLMKVLSAFNSGGQFETTGFGYGPGVRRDQKRLLFILSRASRAPVVAGALIYAAEMVQGGLISRVEQEFRLADAAGFSQLIEETCQVVPTPVDGEDSPISPPPEKAVSREIAGIDILDLEDAVKALWCVDVYAASGMGCTGPVILVAPEDLSTARGALQEAGYL